MPELTGVFKRQLWRSNDSDYFVGLLDDETVVVGEVEEARLISGVNYRFSGKWVEHKKYGKQFKIESLAQLEPHTRRGVIEYLKKYTNGIGPAIASRLWDEYGGEAVKRLRTSPVDCAIAIKRLSVNVAKEASVQLESLVELEDVRIDLGNLLSGRGFPANLYDLAIKRWGIAAPEVIKRDPFKLLVAKLPGAGFIRCDALFLSLGHSPGKIKRQVIFIWNEIKGNRSGHTWINRDSIQDSMQEQVSGCINIQRAVAVGVRARWLVVRSESNLQWLSTNEMAGSESTIVECASEMLNRKVDHGNQEENNKEVADQEVAGQEVG